MKLISQDWLPPDKRESASKEEILSVFESFEREVVRMVEDPLYDMLQINYAKIKELNEELKDLKISINSENKDFDRWLRYCELGKKIAESLIFIRDNSEVRNVKSKEKKSGAMAQRARGDDK